MNIQPINNVNFQCRKGSIERLRPYGKVIQETGTINGKKLDIYSVYNNNGELELGRWIKSKLKFYKGRQVTRIIRSERDGEQT